MNQEIKNLIRQVTNQLDCKTDYELRKVLNGCGITSAMYSRQFYEPGTAEYNTLCGVLITILSKRADKARQGTKDFEITAEYMVNGSKHTLCLTNTERTLEEAKQRLMERQFYSPATGRKIKTPAFTSIDIKQIN